MLRSKSYIGFYTVFLLSSFLWTIIPSFSNIDNTGKTKVFTFNLHRDITPVAWRTVKRAIDEAQAIRADYILISLDTYGGLLDAADSIRTKILSSQIPVLVYITNNAASAGALISIACDSIYMSPIAKIGAASVVDESGNIMPEKYQSYMRTMMRATAEATNRNPDIAEAMVGAIKNIEGIIDSGKVLSFTTKEAIKNNYSNGEANSVQEVLQKANITNYEIVNYNPTFTDNLIGFLLNPVVHGILLILIILGIYFELQHPGIGLAFFTAVIAALLYFAPLYLDGLAANWEILIFIVGLILILLEIFVIPGFGVTGISGIVLTFSGLILSLLRNTGFNFDMSGNASVAQAFAIVFASVGLSVVIIVLFFKRFLRSNLFSRVSLQTAQHKSEGYHTKIFSDANNLKNKTGIVMSDLRPAGKIIIDDNWYDAISEGDYILKGSEVRVVEVQNNYLIVRRMNQ